jgi:hypothetical protein
MVGSGAAGRPVRHLGTFNVLTTQQAAEQVALFDGQWRRVLEIPTHPFLDPLFLDLLLGFDAPNALLVLPLDIRMEIVFEVHDAATRQP